MRYADHTREKEPMPQIHVIHPDPTRHPIIVTPRDGGGWSLTAGAVRLHLSSDETDELIDIIDNNEEN